MGSLLCVFSERESIEQEVLGMREKQRKHETDALRWLVLFLPTLYTAFPSLLFTTVSSRNGNFHFFGIKFKTQKYSHVNSNMGSGNKNNDPFEGIDQTKW